MRDLAKVIVIDWFTKIIFLFWLLVTFWFVMDCLHINKRIESKLDRIIDFENLNEVVAE